MAANVFKGTKVSNPTTATANAGVKATEDEDPNEGVTYTVGPAPGSEPTGVGLLDSGSGTSQTTTDPSHVHASGIRHDPKLNTGTGGLGALQTVAAGNRPDAPVNINTDALVKAQGDALAAGQNVVTQNVQDEATQASNLGRLQAGAGTLTGNYAAAGAAGGQNEATLGQHVIQDAGLSAAQAANDLESSYGQALSASTSQHQALQKQNMDNHVQEISDELASLKTQIAGRKDAQALSMQKYMDDLTASISAYKNASTTGQQTIEMASELFNGVLGALAKVLAMG